MVCNCLLNLKCKPFFAGHPHPNVNYSNSSFKQILERVLNHVPDKSITVKNLDVVHDHCYAKPKIVYRNLNFLSLNVCGIHSKIKYGTFESYIKKFDFICISETKANYIAPDEFPGFISYFASTKIKNGRNQKLKTPELAILVNNNVQKFTKLVENSISPWVLWLKVGKNEENIEFILGCIYIPCENSPYHSEYLFDEICEDILNLQVNFDVPLIIMGDLNARTGTNFDYVEFDYHLLSTSGFVDESSNFLQNMGLLERHNCDKKLNQNGQSFLELCKTFDLRILNGRFGADKGIGGYTCHKANGKSVIDYIAISDCLTPYVLDFNVDCFDRTLSDVHTPLSLTMNMKNDVHHMPIADVPTLSVSGVTQKIKNYKCMWKPDIGQEFKSKFLEPDVKNISDNIQNIDSSNLTTEEMNNLASELSDLFIKTAQSVGLCKEKGSGNRTYCRKYPNKPWFNAECEEKRGEYLSCKNNLRKAKSQAEKRLLKQILDLKFSEYKKFLAKRQFQFQNEFQQKLKNLKNSNPREYWKLINSATAFNKKEGDISLNSFMEHFKKISETEPSENNFDPRNINHSITEDLNSDFTFHEVKKIIRKLKSNKACGIDNVTNEFLKHCPDSVIILIVDIFNLVLKTGVVPTDWCVGIIQPLYKNKGSINNPDNYRGITLLSCISKLFTSCLNHRLTIFALNRGVIGEEQAGFREGYSTTNHSFVLYSIIEMYKQKDRQLFCAFVDYRKAFDLIDRSSLWQKLISEQVNGNFIRVIYNLYEQAKSCVKKGGQISEFFKCTAGVRQGENLSPMLFAIYLNDFENFLKKHYYGLTYLSLAIKRELSDDDIEVFVRLYVLLYADDTILLAESENELQAALNALCTYCNTWKLTVNLSKTKIVIFSKGKIVNHRDFTFNGNPVEVVDEYVYLGTVFNFNGNTAKAVDKQIDQARKASFSIITKARRLLLPIDLQLELFEKTVVPILLFGCEVWGHTNIERIEVFYRKFLKIILKLGFSTPSCQVYGEVGKLPLLNTINKRIISFWLKISEDKPRKYSTIMYNLMFKLHTSRQFYFSWIENVKYILHSCKFINLWERQFEYSTKVMHKTNIFRALDNKCVESWKREVLNNRYSNTYRIYKVDFAFEKYLSAPKLTSYQKISLTKFRCGNNKLPINKCRFSQTVADKFCPFCNIDVGFFIGNECHFLFECGSFNQEREVYLEQYYYINPSESKIKQLFNSQNIVIQRNLAKFTSIIMNKFS